MSDNDKNDKSSKEPKAIEKFSEQEQKEIIEKLKKQIAGEDSENVMLYASLLKSLL